MNRPTLKLTALVASATLILGAAAPARAVVVFSYDSSTGQFPTAQGWGAFDIDTTGPLTAPNTVGTSAEFGNAAIESVDGVPTLHIRDTLSDGAADLPSFYYPWTTQQQQMLINNGLKFTMVFQGLATTGSGKGNVRFGFNGTEFEFQNTNIDPDRTIEVNNFSSTLAPIDGQFHTLEIFGQKVGTEFHFTYRVDGGAESPRNIISNPAPVPLESAVYFGATSSGGTGTDMLVRSITMETLNVVEPVLATVDRTLGSPRGTLNLVNNAAPLTIVGYSITSNGGALDPAQWTSIDDAYDMSGNQSVDPNDEWVELSAPSLRDNLSEFEPDGDGAVLATGQTINLGNVWIQNPDEDVTMDLLLADGTQMPLNVRFQGNNLERFDFGDLNFDGAFNAVDFHNKFVPGFNAATTGLSAAEKYQAGDFNSDGIVDEIDFLIFNDAYKAANPGAAPLSLAVPEPSTIAMLAVALVAGLRARRRLSRHAWRGGGLAIVAASACVAGTSARAADLIAHWKLNEAAGAASAVDSTGGGHNATINGTLTAGVPGVIGNAWQFGGANNFLAVSTAPAGDALLTLDQNFSYSAWVKTTTTSLGTVFSISDDTVTNEEVLLRAVSDQGPGGLRSPDYLARPGVPSGRGAAPVAVNDNQWHFLTVTQDAAGWSLYVDGALQNSGTAAEGLGSALAIGANVATIGAHDRSTSPGVATWAFDGLIDDLAVWNGRLTQQQVQNLYLAGLNGVDAATPFNATLSLQVNRSSGAVTLLNSSGISFDIDAYRITSAGNSLAPGGWSSFDDANLDAGVWTELSATAGKVSEGALGQSTLMADGMPAINLGNLYNTSVDAQDLVFEYHINGQAATVLYQAAVSYVTSSGATADFDSDGDVDGADFLTWQRNVGNNSGTAQKSQGDATMDGNVTAADLTVWRQQFGPAATAAAQPIPEPAGAILSAVGLLSVGAVLRRNRRRATRTAVYVAALAVGVASIARASTVDRDYTLGDDPFEGATIGATLGSNTGGVTYDTAGVSGAGDLQDLNVAGNPTYVSVSDRPGAGVTKGASFDGVDDYLWTPINLGIPSDVWDNTTFFPTTPFPHNYEGIRGQGMQFWAKPNSSLQNVRQDLVKNTGEHGVIITPQNTWGLISDDDAGPTNSGVPVAFNQWTHLMMLSGFSDRINGRSNVGGVLLVNGVAVAARNTAYEFLENNLLTVGGRQVTQSDPLTDPYRGLLDNIEVFLWGTSSANAANYGPLNLGVDNEWIAQQLAGKNPADVNLDGVVSGNGTGPAATDDVTKLIQGYRSRRLVGGVQVGDWMSRQLGDLNFDGIVDLADAYILRQGLVSATGFVLDLSVLNGVGVPEPSSLALAAGSIALVAARRRRR
jgi:hypothetical protein